MAEIFISYARSSAAQAQAVAAALRSEGYGIWFDEDLPAHRGFADVIEERLTAAGAVLVIWSAEAAKSEWVQSEADAARSARKLVQMTVDGARLPMPFDRIQCADLSGWMGDLAAPGWRKVLASIRDLIGDRPGAHAAAPSVTGPAEPLLAVLAFDNLSSDAEMSYFSDGVSEEILQTVARSADLKVIGRGSSFQFRGRDKAAAQVAARLNATHVLDGAVRRSGNKVRISANLIECERQTTLWSDQFDRELSDVFALQDEIAGAVAAALKVAFAPAAPAESIDPAAYTLFLKALEIRNRGLEPATRLEVAGLLEAATDLSPRFARAWEFLATIDAARLRFDPLGQPRANVRAEVIGAARNALELDPSSGSAHQALSQLEPVANFAEREALHLKALAAAPNDPTVLTTASLFFTEVGRIHEALGYAKQSYDLDPARPWAANWYATMLDYAGRFAEAGALYGKLGEQWPDNELIAWNAISSATAHRDWDAFDKLASAVHTRGLDASAAVRLRISWGRAWQDPTPEVRAHAMRAAREELAEAGTVPLTTLRFLFLLGLTAEVFELIDEASFAYMFDADLRSPNASSANGFIFGIGPNVEMMRDARFPRLCGKLGLCDYWVKSGSWPDCADEGVLPYDFKAECRRLAAA